VLEASDFTSDSGGQYQIDHDFAFQSTPYPVGVANPCKPRGLRCQCSISASSRSSSWRNWRPIVIGEPGGAISVKCLRDGICGSFGGAAQGKVGGTPRRASGQPTSEVLRPKPPSLRGDLAAPTVTSASCALLQSAARPRAGVPRGDASGTRRSCEHQQSSGVRARPHCEAACDPSERAEGYPERDGSRASRSQHPRARSHARGPVAFTGSGPASMLGKRESDLRCGSSA